MFLLSTDQRSDDVPKTKSGLRHSVLGPTVDDAKTIID